MTLGAQLIWLFSLSIPIACVSWTITHEELFKEPHDYCVNRSRQSKSLMGRKFFYLFTCEYCFSHYVTILFLFLTGFKLLFTDWRGFIIAGFSLVWIANIYIGLYNLIKVDLKKERAEADLKVEQLNKDTHYVEKKIKGFNK